MTELKSYLRSVWLAFRAMRRNGIDKTAQRMEEIGQQSTFWRNEVTRLYDLATAAHARGDIEAFNLFYWQHDQAVKRFRHEVVDAVDEMTGVPNSISNL